MTYLLGMLSSFEPNEPILCQTYTQMQLRVKLYSMKKKNIVSLWRVLSRESFLKKTLKKLIYCGMMIYVSYDMKRTRLQDIKQIQIY